MEIVTPFVVPIGVFDFSCFLPHARFAFDAAKNTNELKSSNNNDQFLTTLKSHQADSKNDLKFFPNSNAFEDAIVDAVNEFASKIGYFAPKGALQVCNLWLNEMRSGSEHLPHRHGSKQFSGCFYVDVPEKSGNIVFHSFMDRFDYFRPEVKEYTAFNSEIYSYAPQEGQLFFWESWIKHSVPSANFEGVRRSVAVDLISCHR